MDRLPDLHQAVLDEDTVDQLFADIAELTEVLEVICKGAPDAYANAGSISLDAARSLLRCGTARAVQVRYVHDGRPWCDTLTVTPDGVRLVRIAHDTSVFNPMTNKG